MTIYFHKFHENYMIYENLICEIQYLCWNVLVAIGTKKDFKIKRELSASKQYVKISYHEKYPVFWHSENW